MAQEKVTIDIVNSNVNKLERLNLDTWELEEVKLINLKKSWVVRLLQRLGFYKR
jgi:hypothetical protein